MTKNAKILMTATLALGLAGLMTACHKGPAEQTGEKIDNAVQDTRDAVRDTAHDVKHDIEHDTKK